jgi:SMODS and SLOG-associating 2TM effector domain 2
MSARDDLAPASLLAQGARDVSDAETLERLVGEASARATEIVRWYLSAKRSKALWARTLRVTAIVGVAAAGVIPVIVTLLHRQDGRQLFDAAWASIAIAGSAFCIALDRFFGFSSAWMRFITTELETQRQLDAFQYDWLIDRATWSDGRPTKDQLMQTLARCKVFVQELDKLVQQETNLWIAEFQDVLKQIDDASRARSAVAEQGAINITVTGVDGAAGGWLLAIDGGAPTLRFGDTAAVLVLPGVHIIRVSIQAGDQRRAAEKAVTVAAGSSVAVAMDL